MQKTLGGERLGAGKKMKVDLHNFERSTHDLSYLWRSSMSAGTLVPFMCEVGLPGDTFDIDLECDVKTLPTVGPLFGSYKVQLDVFVAPIRLYNSLLHNNALGIGMKMSQVILPKLKFVVPQTNVTPADIDNCHINPSCILSYLGLRGFGMSTEIATATREFNAVPFLAYWEIYKQYYSNKMEEKGAVIHSNQLANTGTVSSVRVQRGTAGGGPATIPLAPTTAAVTIQNGYLLEVVTTANYNMSQVLINTAEYGTKSFVDLCSSRYSQSATLASGLIDFAKWGVITIINYKLGDLNTPLVVKPSVSFFPLENIDNMRNNLLAFQSKTVPYLLSKDTTSLEPYSFIFQSSPSTTAALSSQEGLALKTYQSDLFNNWLKTEFIDGPTGIGAITAIDTSDGSFTLDTLNLSQKVYNMLNRIAVSGGSYDDWLDAVYAHDRYKRAESPIYMGGLIKELVFQEVISTAETAGNPLATLAGKGALSKKHRGGKTVVKIDEPSYILAIASITPRIDYSQGNKWDTGLITLDDLHKPSLGQIGFQDLITEQMAWWDTRYSQVDGWVQKSAGKQPAWINYMTNVNQTRGNFAVGPTANNSGNGVPVGQMYMTLNRRYEGTKDSGITDLTTYIDPSKFNFIFAQTSLDSQNFWTQIAVNITARRKMSAKIMPNL
ncbi:MAG: major capsid protein [Microvirus sp.]|nr:MAG: major capsid protein [Microvirus sp.]